jgi:hypothetical protein
MLKASLLLLVIEREEEDDSRKGIERERGF